MTLPSESDQDEQAGLAHRVARLLRHEVGDFLQTVYSTAAILTERLPATLSQERRLVADLRGRAELCRFELDAAVDLLGSPRLRPGRVDLFPLLAGVVAQAQRRYPAVTVLLEGEGGLFVNADGQALAGAVTFLLLVLGQAARQRVDVRLARADSRAVCTLERDGSAIHQDQLDWLRQPFASTHHGLFGLALAVTRRATEPCGGLLAILPREDGGPSVQLSFPVMDA